LNARTRDRHHFQDHHAFGGHIQAFGLALGGVMSEEQWIEFVGELAKAIGMTPAYEPAVWHFPHEDKGGEGIMVVQPITESFIVADTWTAHKSAYVFVSSCKSFDPGPVSDLARRYGLAPSDQFLTGLELPR